MLQKKITYSANNTKIQIRINGWKNISVTSGTFLVNGAERLAYYYNIYSKSSASDVTITTIPSGYRVQNSIINVSRVDKNVVSIIDDSGNVKLTGTGTGTSHIIACGSIKYSYLQLTQLIFK